MPNGDGTKRRTKFGAGCFLLEIKPWRDAIFLANSPHQTWCAVDAALRFDLTIGSYPAGSGIRIEAIIRGLRRGDLPPRRL